MRYLAAVLLVFVALLGTACGGGETATSGPDAAGSTLVGATAAATSHATPATTSTTSPTTTGTSTDSELCGIFDEMLVLDAEADAIMEEFNRKAAQITGPASEEEGAQLLEELQAAIRVVDDLMPTIRTVYDRAIAVADPVVAEDLAAMRDGSSGVWNLVALPIMEAESVEEWLLLRQQAAEDPSFVELVDATSEAQKRLDEFATSECGFSPFTLS